MTVRTVLTFAALTVQEASRRRVLRALAGLTIVLLALSAFGFSRIEAEFGAALTTGEARLAASTVLNLVMFGLSLIAALGTAFLAGPVLAGEIESGMALAVLARPARRSAVLVGKWLGLVAFGSGFVAVAGFAHFVVVWATVGYWPPDPAAGLALLAAQTTVLLTLGLLPTDGLWRGAMHAFQDPGLLFTLSEEFNSHPFLSLSPLTGAYLAWTALWVALVLGLAAVAFLRRDL